jgi:hypothetical protein
MGNSKSRFVFRWVIQKWDCPLDREYAAPIAQQKQSDEVSQGVKTFNERSHNEQTFSPLDYSLL